MNVTPTVHPAEPFDPAEDANTLKTAFKGFGCDEKEVMDIITKRSNAQRQQIAIKFKTMYGKDLIDTLKSELRGNFEDIIVALMIPPAEYYAKHLHKALSGVGTDEQCLIEILGTLNNLEITFVREAYQRMYGNELESDIIGDTSGSLKKLFVALANGSRDESHATDRQLAYADAQTLLRAGELFAGTDESTFNEILCQRNRHQIQLIFEEYQHLTGHDFESAINNEFSGTTKDVLLSLVKAIRNIPEFLAERLYYSMHGMGTDDKTLIRIIVTRSEVDLGEIKGIVESKYGKSLADFIQKRH